MRRGRTLSGLIALLAFMAFATVVPSAFADGGTPMDICQDLQDGKLDGTYTQAQLNAFLMDPTVQGYCGPITVIVTPPPTTTTTTTPTTPPTTPPQPCTETGQSAPPAGAGGTVGGNGTPAQCASTKPAVHVVPVVVSAVAGARHTISAPAPAQIRPAAVKGTQHTVRTPRQATAPLTTTKTRGTLPFTGAQLTLFLLVGLGLVATGLVLRTTGRRPQE